MRSLLLSILTLLPLTLSACIGATRSSSEASGDVLLQVYGVVLDTLAASWAERLASGEVILERSSIPEAISTREIERRGFALVEEFDACHSDQRGLRITAAKKLSPERFEVTVWEDARDALVSPTRFTINCTAGECRVESEESGGDYMRDCDQEPAA